MKNTYLKLATVLPLLLVGLGPPCWSFIEPGPIDPSVESIPKWNAPSVVPEFTASNGSSNPGKELVQQARSLEDELRNQSGLNAAARYPTETKINGLLYDAAKMGNRDALFFLADKYRYANIHIPKPLPAINVYTEILLKHAQAGNVSAAYCIGFLYDKDLIGSTWPEARRANQAYNWYRKSASAGMHNASLALAALLAQYRYRKVDGLYTPEQVNETAVLLKRAANVSDQNFLQSVSRALYSIDREADASTVNEKIAQQAFETGQTNAEWWKDFFSYCSVDKAVEVKWLSKLLDGPAAGNRKLLELRIDAYIFSTNPQKDLAIKDLEALLSREGPDLYWFAQKVELQQELGRTSDAWMTVREACRSNADFKKRTFGKLCEKVEKLPPTPPLSTTALNELLVRLNRCIENSGQDDFSYRCRGEILKRLGRSAEAQRDFATADKLLEHEMEDYN